MRTGVPRVPCQSRPGLVPVPQRNDIQPGDPRLRLVDQRRVPQRSLLLLGQRTASVRFQEESQSLAFVNIFFIFIVTVDSIVSIILLCIVIVDDLLCKDV